MAGINLTVYRGFATPGVYVWSPFVSKLEARLRFGGLAYHIEAGSMSKSPNKKIPYVGLISNASGHEAKEEPSLMSDSTLIIRKFVSDGKLPDLNGRLSPSARTYDLALTALLEDKLYWYQGYEKWHENYYAVREKALWNFSYPMKVVIGLLAYRGNMQKIDGQGSGRLSGPQMRAFMAEIWQSFDTLLAESRRKCSKESPDAPFWLLAGDAPSEADATLFGFIASAMVCEALPESQKVLRSLPSTMEYASRIHHKFFPDYEFWS